MRTYRNTDVKSILFCSKSSIDYNAKKIGEQIFGFSLLESVQTYDFMVSFNLNYQDYGNEKRICKIFCAHTEIRMLRVYYFVANLV